MVLLRAIIYCVINIYNFVTKKLYLIISHNVLHLYLLNVFQKLYIYYFIYTVVNGLSIINIFINFSFFVG